MRAPPPRPTSPWANQAVVTILLENVRGPAGHAAHREDRGEEVDGNAERIVGGRRIEVHVGVEALDPLDGLLHALGQTVEFFVACPPAEFFREDAQVGGARVFGPVDAMAEAGNLHLPRQRAGNAIHGLVLIAQFEQPLDDVLIGAAVERTLQCADAAGDGGVNIG